jgi:glycosyltransferase involved in cell wall biosynthesis
MKPLVSILIPAYNAEEYLAATLRCALDQTWDRKEIIVVDDGSRDSTLAIARSFESASVRVFTQDNQGAATTRNTAYGFAQGDLIQWLDADDLMSLNKIASQVEAYQRFGSAKTLLSSPWATFLYRPSKASFERTALWEDMNAVEWLTRKMENNLHMQTATWLVSRELSEASGAWNPNLLIDDDGEYFARVLMKCDLVRFVPEGRVYYRMRPSNRLSYVGRNVRKMEAQMRSLEMSIGYLRSMEDSPRVRAACVTCLETWLPTFHPDRPDLVSRAQALAASWGGHLSDPKLPWKYSWIQRLFGWSAAKLSQIYYNELKAWMVLRWDRTLFRLSGGDHSYEL